MISRVGFIGAGKVGTSLGVYFKANGISVSGYCSRSTSSAETAAIRTGTSAFCNCSELVKNSSIVFVTTPDDAIASVWESIRFADVNGKMICHTSGMHSSRIFAGIKSTGAYGYSVHPAFPFPSADMDLTGLKNACFTIEGDGEHIGDLTDLFSGFGNRVMVINADKKPLYHLANTIAANLVLSLIDMGCSDLAGCGMTVDEALSVLMPLVESNVSNIKRQGLAASITGPVERADSGTVKRHLDILPAGQDEIYRILSANLVSIVRKKHPDKDYSTIETILSGRDMK